MTAAGQIKSIIERVERLEEEKAALAADIKEVFAEAKGNGFDVKVLRRIIKIRAQDSAERQEQEAILDLYQHALGMIVEHPTTAPAQVRLATPPPPPPPSIVTNT